MKVRRLGLRESHSPSILERVRLHGLLLDIRQAVSGFRKSPAIALVAVVSLALAIGANIFVLGVLNTVVLRPFEVSDPQSLYQIRYGPRMSGSNLTTSYPAFQDLRRRNTSFSDMTGINPYSQRASGSVTRHRSFAVLPSQAATSKCLGCSRRSDGSFTRRTSAA